MALLLAGTGLARLVEAQSIETGRRAWWRFNETTGLTAQDSSPNKNHGQLVDYLDASAAWTSGKVGGALRLDGVANRVVVPDSPSFALSTDASFAFWLNPASYGTVLSAGSYDHSQGRIIRKGGHFDVYVVDNPGGVRKTIMANTANAPQNCLETNQWQHFAIVIRSGLVQFYKNGFPIGGTVPGTLGPSDELAAVIGNFDETLDTPRFFEGLLDELGLWDRPLSESEVLELAGKDASGAPAVEYLTESVTRLENTSADFQVLATGKRPVFYQWQYAGKPMAGATNSQLSLTALTEAQAGVYTVAISNSVGQIVSLPITLTVQVVSDVKSGLVAYWNFDETSGTTFRDASGHNHDAALKNGTVGAGVVGQVGGAYDFDGVDDFAVVAHAADLNMVGEGTVSFWVNPRTHGSVSGGYARVVRKGINYDLALLSGNSYLTFFGVNKTPYNSPNNSIELGVWQHWAVVAKNGVFQFYKNGQPNGAPITGQLAAATSDPLVIGNYQSDLNIARVFDGLMDELGIWTRALKASEIADLYQNGVQGKPLNISTEPMRIRQLELLANNQFRITFSSPYSNRSYAVQQKSSLSDPQWTDVAGAQVGQPNQGVIQATFTRAQAPAGFYRLVLIP